MKKIILPLLSLVLALCCTLVLADQVSLGGGYTVNIPAGYTMETGTTDEGTPYTVYANSAIEMYIYTEGTDGEAMSELVSEIAQESNATQQGITPINGIEAGYIVAPYTDEDGTFINILYILPAGDQAVLVDFYMTKESDSQQTADIMNTLSGNSAAVPAAQNTSVNTVSGTMTAIGSTGLSFRLPETLESDELTADEIQDGVLAVYVNDEMDLTVSTFDAEGYSAAELAKEFADDLNGTVKGQIQCGSITMNGCSGSYTEDGDQYACEIYVAVSGDQALTLEFYWEQGAARPAEVDAILSSIR